MFTTTTIHTLATDNGPTLHVQKKEGGVLLGVEYVGRQGFLNDDEALDLSDLLRSLVQNT